MRVFTYIAPAMRPRGSSKRITVKDNQFMYTVKPIIYTYTYIHYYILYFLFPNQTDHIERNNIKTETFTTTKEVKDKNNYQTIYATNYL